MSSLTLGEAELTGRTFPDLEPLYNAARSYLEISQRIDLLNARVDVSMP